MKGKEIENNDEWVDRLKAGDQKAFTEIYKAYWYKMYQRVYRKINNKEAAEEIVQEVFTRLWKERQSLSVTYLDRYLYSAVRYEVIDYLRSRIETTTYDEYFSELQKLIDTETEDTILYNDLQAFIHYKLKDLSSQSSDIFILSRFEYWSVADIAKHYKLSEKAIEYHITKVLKHLRFCLSE